MAERMCFGPRVNVIYQTINNETVIINLDNGRYYSLNATASFIWESLMKSRTIDDIVHAFASSTAADKVPDTVARFVDELVDEGLVAPKPVETRDSIPPERTNLKFEPPLLEKFTDMEKLIPLDPIHQVGTMGWPFPQENQK